MNHTRIGGTGRKATTITNKKNKTQLKVSDTTSKKASELTVSHGFFQKVSVAVPKEFLLRCDTGRKPNVAIKLNRELRLGG